MDEAPDQWQLFGEGTSRTVAPLVAIAVIVGGFIWLIWGTNWLPQPVEVVWVSIVVAGGIVAGYYQIVQVRNSRKRASKV